MSLKKRGKEYSLVEEQARADFAEAADCTADLLMQFDEMGLDKGPALGGALTQIIHHLITVSPDTTSALGLLSSCIQNAACTADSTSVYYMDAGDTVH